MISFFSFMEARSFQLRLRSDTICIVRIIVPESATSVLIFMIYTNLLITEPVLRPPQSCRLLQVWVFIYSEFSHAPLCE